jgi:hypothetical protein
MVAGPEKDVESGKAFAKGNGRGKMWDRRAGHPEEGCFIEGEKTSP